MTKTYEICFPLESNDLDDKPSIESIIHTESLCMDDSWLEFKTGIFDFHALKPKLILLSTDGYCNSFNNTSGFLKIGLDYLSLIGGIRLFIPESRIFTTY